MLILSVDIHVKPEHREAFVEASRLNHLGTRQEPGNLRFDVLQDSEDPNRFALYEVYRDRSALEAHQKTPHYLAWKAAVEPFMAVPRQKQVLSSLFPASEGDW